MPEGPEIRLAADKIANVLVGHPVKEVYFAFPELQPFSVDLEGETVTHVATYGKAMVTRFTNGLNIYSHNQLYGRWEVRRAYNYPQTKRSLRLAIHNAQHSALLYSASDIMVLSDEELPNHPFIRRIGPDLLDERVTVEQVAQRFLDKRFRGRRLHTILLDQGFLAGVGNYLRSEVLFVGGVHPQKRPLDCSPEQINSLAHAAVSLTRQSYQTKGITNDLELVRQLKAQGVSRRNYRHWAFYRDGQPCYQCGAPIIKDEMGSRRIYFCPNCQPAQTAK